MNAQKIIAAYRIADEEARLNLFSGFRDLRDDFQRITEGLASTRNNPGPDPLLFLRLSFLLGGIADFLVGINWLLISIGLDVPSLISSYQGTGADYRFAMYISTMFMFGWTALLFWGYRSPLERRGLLVITAVFLAISIGIELLFFRDILHGPGFLAGLFLRLLIIGKFSFSTVYSMRK